MLYSALLKVEVSVIFGIFRIFATQNDANAHHPHI